MRWLGAAFCSAINAVISAAEYQQHTAETATALPTLIQ
jgi:hypothetical protein